MLRLTSLLSLLLVAFAFTACQRCVEEACADGSEPCVCRCDDGFSGDRCEIEQVPSRIYIDAVEITEFPTTRANQTSWDAENDKPDLRLAIENLQSDQLLFESTEIRQNASGTQRFSTDFPIQVQHVSEPYRLLLLDDDADLDAEQMATIDFSIYQTGERFPPSFTIESDACKATLTVRYEW